jgi:hypothetical protein
MLEWLAARRIAVGCDSRLLPAVAVERSSRPLTRASLQSYAVETMALCLALRLLLLPRKGE